MTTYIDCPACSSEVLVSEEISETNVRCPDCLQWIEDEYDTAHAFKTYYGASLQIAGRYDDDYDPDNYGYDY
jgi:DNA-directed RNA polymerase subunit M/transcription elongation factor TFIIS